MFHRKIHQSLEEAAASPAAVRHLRLWRVEEAGAVELEALATLLPQLTGLRKIELGWQPWTELPRELSGLPKLQSLVVLNIPLMTFPAFLAACPRLTELVLRGTDIAGLPASVQALRGLRRLDFSNNPRGRQIPSEIGQLSELREVQLADLGLTSLPYSMAGLKRLRRLLLGGMNSFDAVELSRIRSWFRRGVVSGFTPLDEVVA